MAGYLRSIVDSDHEHRGNKMVLDPLVQVARFGVDSRCCDASIVVSAEDTNVRTITIQLKKQDGSDVDAETAVFAFLTTTAAKVAFVTTGGSTGIAIGTDGALLALVAKKVFMLTSESDGDIDLSWTDTGTEAAFLNLWLPNGKVITSTALTNT